MTYEIETIAKHYLICLLWSSCDDDVYLDSLFDVDNLSDEITNKAFADCRLFWDRAKQYLNENLTEKMLSRIGHDLALTRNRHGAGFWDSPEVYGKQNAEILTDISHSFPEVCLYIGDDKKLYQL